MSNPDVYFTVFAPTNVAIANTPEQDINTITANTQTSKSLKEQVLKYHLIRFYPENGEKAFQMYEFGDRILQSDTIDSLRLFFRQLQRGETMVQFVNGAELTEYIEASNGAVYIIDRFLHQIASKSSTYSYLKEHATNKYIEMRTKKFLEILDASEHLINTPFSDLNSDSTYVTIFVPTDMALQDLTTERMGQLKNNKYQLVKLLRRHVISSTSGLENAGTSAVYHASLLEFRRYEALQGATTSTAGLAEIPAMEGSIKPISVNNELYVTNTCGRVKVLMTAQFNRYSSRRPEGTPVFANNTVHNGVVHLVDGLLGYIYIDAYGMIREDLRAGAMKDYIERAPDSWADRLRLPLGSNIRPHQKITLFVPINDAFYDVENAINMQHFTKNITYVQEVLNLHILRGQHSLTDITGTTTLPTLLADHTATFRWQSDDLYVSVGHVEARVVVPDICVENGIIHYVDAVLGVPYRTIFDYIDKHYHMLELFKAVRKSGAEIVLNNVQKPVTFFAPTNEAFELMQETRVGRELLAPEAESENKLQKVLIAHASRGYHYIDDIISNMYDLPESQLTLIKDGEDYYVERRGSYQTVRARILEKNLRMTNGVLYIIDRVLFENSEAAFRAIPVSSTRWNHPSLSMTMSSLASFVMCFCILDR